MMISRSPTSVEIETFLHASNRFERGTLLPVVHSFLDQKNQILELAAEHQTPFYLFDKKRLASAATEFLSAFRQNIHNFQPYYAVKSNPHPLILDEVIRLGYGLDVSSKEEFNLALQHQAPRLVFSGPGKNEDDLALVLQHADIAILHMDSFGELERMGAVTNQTRTEIKAGIRVFTSYHGKWTKFGIPLERLKEFFLKAQDYPYIKLQGIQFHSSWNTDVLPYQKIIAEIGNYLADNFTPAMLSQIKFFDFGGGFLPYQSEGYYPETTPQGKTFKSINNFLDRPTEFNEKFYIADAVPISTYASGIADAIDQHLSPIIDATYFSEPGRIICNRAMHIILKIMDVKSAHEAIVDGGINAVGFERFETDYFPILNLTHPSDKELPFVLYGSLCTPHDLWGYYCHASKMSVGDILLVPYQGAYTYTLAQNFIKPIPLIYEFTAV